MLIWKWNYGKWDWLSVEERWIDFSSGKIGFSLHAGRMIKIGVWEIHVKGDGRESSSARVSSFYTRHLFL